MQRVLEEQEGIRFFMDATKDSKRKNKVKKNKEKAVKRAIMNL